MIMLPFMSPVVLGVNRIFISQVSVGSSMAFSQSLDVIEKTEFDKVSDERVSVKVPLFLTIRLFFFALNIYKKTAECYFGNIASNIREIDRA